MVANVMYFKVLFLDTPLMNCTHNIISSELKILNLEDEIKQEKYMWHAYVLIEIFCFMELVS